jgi:hypothetical protein
MAVNVFAALHVERARGQDVAMTNVNPPGGTAGPASEPRGRFGRRATLIAAVAVVLAVLAAVAVLVSKSGREQALAEAVKGTWSCGWSDGTSASDQGPQFTLDVGDGTWSLRVGDRPRGVGGTWSIADGRLVYEMVSGADPEDFEVTGVPETMVDAFSGVIVGDHGDLGFDARWGNGSRHVELSTDLGGTFVCDRQE